MSEFIALSSCIVVTESFLETNFFLANIYQLSVYCLERGLNKVQTQIVNLIIKQYGVVLSTTTRAKLVDLVQRNKKKSGKNQIVLQSFLFFLCFCSLSIAI